MSTGKKKMEGNPDAALTSIGNYVFSKTLGEGNFAKVKLAKHKITGLEAAVKIIDKMSLDDKKLSKLYREVRLMKLLHHPNIVKLIEVVETKNTIFLVMEYVSGGELYDYLVVHGRMKEKEARAKFRQIMSAVSYCHKKRVIHRDLKAENLLLDNDMNIKIADFGFSNQFDPDGKLDTFCGSPPYAAPELFQGKRYTGPEVDIWSCGVILYVLTTGCLPFDGKNLQEMRESVCRGKYRIPFYLSEGCEKLLRKFLIRDSTKRPSLDMLIEDAWLNEGFDSSPVVKSIADKKIGKDDLIMTIMEDKFGLAKDVLSENLRENVYDEAMAIYFLLWNEKQRHGEDSVKKIADQMAITKVAAHPTSKLPAPHLDSSAGHTPIPAINEDGTGASYKNLTSHNAQAPVNAAAPHQQPQRRTRRATVSGAAEMKKVAQEVNEDPALVEQLKKLQVGAAASRPSSLPRSGTPSERPQSVVESGDSKPVESAPLADVKKPQGRKRTNTITGFLKLRRDGAKDSTTDTTEGVGSTESLENDPLDASKPRSLRFTFNSNTTSSKEPDEIVKEVIKAIKQHNHKHRLVSRYIVECEAEPPNDLPGDEPIKVNIEVCKLPRLKNLHGLRFKRVTGATNDYKTVCEQLLADTKL